VRITNANKDVDMWFSAILIATYKIIGPDIPFQ
jgi:hypothetical protein